MILNMNGYKMLMQITEFCKMEKGKDLKIPKLMLLYFHLWSLPAYGVSQRP